MIDLAHIRLPLCQSVLIQDVAIGPCIRANNPPICEDWIGLPVLYLFLAFFVLLRHVWELDSIESIIEGDSLCASNIC